MEAMICKACGAPLRANHKCEYCGTFYDNSMDIYMDFLRQQHYNMYKSQMYNLEYLVNQQYQTQNQTQNILNIMNSWRVCP